MEKRYLVLVLIVWGVFLLFNANIQGNVVRVKTSTTDFTDIQDRGSSFQLTAPPPGPIATAAPIIQDCSTPQIIDPSGPSSQEQPQIDDINGRFVVWTDSIPSGANIAYYDLGPNLIYGDSDDGGKFVIPSPDIFNAKAKIHNGKIMWLSYNPPYMGGYKNINSCIIPCTSVTNILSSSNYYIDIDFYNNLLVYSELLNPNTLPYTTYLYIYDQSTGATNIIYYGGENFGTSIVNGAVIFIHGVFTVPPGSVYDIFIYDISTASTIQVTSNPGNAGVGTPKISLMIPGTNILGFDQDYGAGPQIATYVLSGGVLQPVSILSQQSGILGDLDYDPTQNFISILYFTSGGTFFEKYLFTSQNLLFIIPNLPNLIGYGPADVYSDTAVLRAKFNGGITKITISKC